METDGLIVLDKPRGITSRDAVDRAQRWFPRRTKLGHAGTLDPLATGVLVLAVGGATRLVEYVQRISKAYDSTFRLGATSDTDDADGTVTPVVGATDPGLDAVRRGLSALVGPIAQTPPAYSAAHVGGRRAYALARQGEEVRLEARTVTVDAIDVVRYEWPELDVRVECGKGTYIRSLARDLGAALGVGAYVRTLRRTRIGPFTPEQATPLDADGPRLLPAGTALAELPRVEIDAAAAARLRTGQAVAVAAADAAEVGVFADGRATAVGAVAGGLLRPVKVLG